MIFNFDGLAKSKQVAKPKFDTQEEGFSLTQRHTQCRLSVGKGSTRQEIGFITTPSILALYQQGGEG